MTVATRTVDVLIVGGGPAGSASAIALAGRGRSVLVVERSDYTSPRIGETLPSLANPTLSRLGLDLDSLASGHLTCPGSVSIWGSDVPYINDSLFDRDGEGLHLDRPRFDAALACRAEEAGAIVLTCAEVRSCRRDGAAWDVTIGHVEESLDLRAGTLIDAAGRGRWPGRPSRRRSFDRQVALMNFFDLDDGCPAHGDRRTWIEAAPDGWWYSSCLPDNRLVAAYFTESDLLDAPRSGREGRWDGLLAEAPQTRHRLRLARPQMPPRVLSVSSTLSLPIVAPGYVAVGDGASTIDPLSSHGIVHALTSGLAAAEALTDPDVEQALDRYAGVIVDRFRGDLRTRREFCRSERRWPTSEFWTRRWGLTPARSASP